MKKFIIAVILFSVSFCAFSQTENPRYISENFAILGVKAVKVIGTFYVKEITAKDFKTLDNSVVEGFNIDNETFLDNGKGNDKIANDGIYTSMNVYETKEEKEDVVVLSNNIIFSESFKFEKEMEKYLAANEGTKKFGVSIKCDVASCTCAECHCRACNYNWGETLNWCFTLKNCSVEFNVGW